MKNFILVLLTVFINAAALQTALASVAKAALVPLPSVDDFTNGNDGWSFALGLGIEYEAAYEGADEYGFEVDPAGGVQWRRGDDIFFWAGEAIGWRGLRSNVWLVEIVLAFDEGREEGDSDKGHLDGLGESEEDTEIVLQVRRDLGSDWRYWLDGRAIFGDNGHLGLIGLGRRFSEQNNGSGHEISIAAVFQDSDYANKDFGINSEQAAASGLAETYLSGGFRSVGVNYNYRHYINDNWQVFGEAVYERYKSAIQNSPIARSQYEAEVGIGVIYVF